MSYDPLALKELVLGSVQWPSFNKGEILQQGGGRGWGAGWLVQEASQQRLLTCTCFLLSVFIVLFKRSPPPFIPSVI